MRSTTILLAAGIVVSGCSDALGPAGGCDSEMRETRRIYGFPDDVRSEENSGDFFETWTYEPDGSEPGRFIVFRWGNSIDGCVVDDPVSIDLVPIVSLSPTRSSADFPRPSANRTA